MFINKILQITFFCTYTLDYYIIVIIVIIIVYSWISVSEKNVFLFSNSVEENLHSVQDDGYNIMIYRARTCWVFRW